MLKYFFSRTRRVDAPLCHDGDPVDWIRDPLAHPQIEAMDERQRADLPFRAFPPGTAAGAAGVPCQAV